MRADNLSSGTPSSTRNVDGAGPTNMLEDLPSKKSQLDLKSFGVGVLVVGRMLSPWLWFHTEASKISLLIARVWQLWRLKGGAWMVLTHGKWGECAAWEPVIVRGLEGNTWAKIHKKIESKLAHYPKWRLNQSSHFSKIHTHLYRTFHTCMH